MAGSYDGSIRIDTSINSQPIDSGLSSIENKIKSIGKTIGLAFGVKELIDFGKRAVTSASDLTEAQNVVDTAFGDMSWKMEQFAATALETYGISELTAKNMGSTYMAMAKGMGVATDAASDMAVTLTGRLSDIMSFYNKTQSEVDTIGRAMITGEMEPLKAIGVVMTQTNLSAYALAKGYEKTYDAMSANEQLIVRYKYFLEQTAMAQGDFAKTSEGWANQTRLLSERLNEFMTNLGGLLMNTLTPALEFANEAVSFLNELFFGGKDNAENTSAVKNAEAVTDEVTSMGAAADKSKKKLNNLIAGFDELHIISGAKSDKDKEQATDAGIDTSNLLGVNLDADTKTAKKAAGKYRDVINEIYLAFKRHPLTKTVEGIIKGVGKFFGFIKDNNKISAGNIVDTLMDILGAILAYKAVKGIVGGVSAFSKSFGGLIGLITAHPVAAAVVGITGLAVGIYKLSEELERQRIASCFGDISISLEEINELVDPITESVDKIAGAFDEKSENLSNARNNFREISDAVQATADSFKNNDLEQDVKGFADQLDELLNSAMEVNKATFDTSAWETMFLEDDGVIDEREQEILDSFKDMGDSVGETIKNYAAKIHEITSAAIEENRELTEAEIANLESLHKKLRDLTLSTEQTKSEATWERLKSGAYTFDSYAELAEEIKKAQEQEEKAREEAHQAAYEDVLSMLGTSLAAGEISEEEYEQKKAELFKEADEKIKAMEINSARHQREVLLAFAQGAFTNVAKSYTSDEDELKKMQTYYDLLLQMPDNLSEAHLLEYVYLGNRTNQLMQNVHYGVLEDIKKQFGLDIMSELEKLNTEIGDSAFDLNDYYKTIETTLDDFTGLDVDDILPTLEEFKDRPEAYTAILNQWLQYQSYAIQLGVEFDKEDAINELNDFIKQNYKISPYINTSANNGENQQTTVNLFINDERQETVTATAGANLAFDFALRDFNKDNGKAR